MRSPFNIALIVLLFISCEEKFIENDFDPGYDYFPVEVGSFRVYDVTEVNFNASGPDTSRYELKNTITQRIAQGGADYYVLQRERRAPMESSWAILDVWSIRRNQYGGVVVEENVPYIKITFPVIVGNTWDGHAYNTMDVSEYEYRPAPEATYDPLIEGANKILVQISDIPQNLVNRDQRYEVYAKGIGLVEKNYIILNYCTSNCGSEEVDSGMIIEQVLKAYGKD